MHRNFRGEAMAKTTTPPLTASPGSVTSFSSIILSSLKTYRTWVNVLSLLLNLLSSAVDPEFFEVLCPQEVKVKVDLLRKKKKLFHLTFVNG